MNTEHDKLLYRIRVDSDSIVEFYCNDSKVYFLYEYLPTRTRWMKAEYPKAEYEYFWFFEKYLGIDARIITMIRANISDTIISIFTRIYRKMEKDGICAMSIDELVNYLNNEAFIYMIINDLYLDIKYNPSVKFERVYPNTNTKTFDYIDIEFKLINRDRSFDELKVWVKENKKHFNQLVKIVTAPKLQSKYGVPINCLKVDSCILTRDCRLLYKLSLKEVK